VFGEHGREHAGDNVSEFDAVRLTFFEADWGLTSGLAVTRSSVVKVNFLVRRAIAKYPFAFKSQAAVTERTIS
jgi:hypothetical protein